MNEVKWFLIGLMKMKERSMSRTVGPLKYLAVLE